MCSLCVCDINWCVYYIHTLVYGCVYSINLVDITYIYIYIYTNTYIGVNVKLIFIHRRSRTGFGFYFIHKEIHAFTEISLTTIKIISADG